MIHDLPAIHAEALMRTLVLFAAVALGVMASPARAADFDCDSPPATLAFNFGTGRDIVTGSGNIVEERRAASGFTALKVAGSIDVELKAAEREGVTVRADDNIVPLIETRVEGTTLVVGAVRGASFRTRHSPRVIVEFVRLNEVSVSGSGDVRADRVRGETFAVSVSGSSDVRIVALDVDSLGVVISGSGDFAAAGRAAQQGFRIKGSGDVIARDLVGRIVKVSIAGSGDAAVHATDELEVSIAGSGDVVYRGDPKVTKKIAGSGAVRQAK
jgi:hypothetical protein